VRNYCSGSQGPPFLCCLHFLQPIIKGIDTYIDQPASDSNRIAFLNYYLPQTNRPDTQQLFFKGIYLHEVEMMKKPASTLQPVPNAQKKQALFIPFPGKRY
jgi:hypothetical protein